MRFLHVNIILSVICALLCVSISAQEKREVRLYGDAPQYAGFNVNVDTYADYITHLAKTLVTLRIDNNGHFDEVFELDDVAYVYVDLGALRATAFLRPGVDYQIVMPPFIARTDADRFNPFFIPEEVELGIANEMDAFNESMRNYNSAFGDTFHVEAVQLVRTHNRAVADSLIAHFDAIAEAQNCDDAFFRKYVFYRDASIYAMPRLRSVRNVTKSYFAGRNVEFAVPSYWEAFDLIYKDFLTDYVRSRGGRQLASTMTNPRFSFVDLRSALLTDSLYSDTIFCETLLLKSLYDGAYSGRFSESRVDSLLVNAYLSASCQATKNLARNILAKRNHLKPGTLAPDFTLLDTKGNEVSLSNYRGKFVYLGFFHTQNYQCLKDFPGLSGMEKKYRRDVVVVGIMTDEESDKLDLFFDKRRMEWKVVSFTAQQSVVLDYQISSLPAYYLIDPDGLIALANAPGPDENIEKVIADQMLKYRRSKMKETPDGVRDIYDIVRDVQYK